MTWDGAELAALMEPAIARVFRYLRKSSADEAKAHGLTSTQVQALRALLLGESLRMSELAVRLELSNSACSTMIDQLGRLGLVDKCLDAADRRATLVGITPRGREVATAIVVHLYRRLADAMQGLRPAERYMVLGGLEALASLVDES